MNRQTKEIGSLSYISTAVFNSNFFTYTVTTGRGPAFVRTGTLTAVLGATSSNCPAGRVLRENGKKLFPNAHNGVRTYMVGVYDSYSFLNGFINPNDPMFAPYNTDRPNYQDDSLYTGDFTTKNLGPSVLTLGQVASSGDISTAGQVTAADQIRSTTVSVITTSTGTLTLDPAVGQVFKLTTTLTGAVTLAVAQVGVPGAVLYVMISNGGGRAFVGDGTTVITSASATLTNGKAFSITLVSDGTAFREMSRMQYA